MRETWFDRIIGYFSPRSAVERIRYRSALMSLRAYEGATKGRRAGGWNASSLSADSEIAIGGKVLRDRARDLVRSDGYAEGGIESIVNNVVGAGIEVKLKHPDAGALERLKRQWKAWAETPFCDAVGSSPFVALQAIAVASVATDGELLVKRQRLKYAKADGRVPLKIQLLEADYIDTSRTGVVGDNEIVRGIEYAPDGTVAAYWLFERHPGDISPIRLNFESKRIPASEIIHIYKPKRASQRRGASALAPALLRLRDFAEYEDAQLVRQKIAACFAGFIETPDGHEGVTTEKDSDGLYREKVQPGMLYRGGPGEKVTFATPPPVQNYGEYSRGILRGVAKGIGTTYEELTGDYSMVNFSSGRMGRMSLQRTVERWQWHVMVPQFCQGVFEWFKEAAALVDPAASQLEADWTPPPLQMIDPGKEIAAQISQVRAGFKSRSQIVRETGYDPVEVTEEIAKDNKSADELGLILDSDPRTTSKVGFMQGADQLEMVTPYQKPKQNDGGEE